MEIQSVVYRALSVSLLSKLSKNLGSIYGGALDGRRSEPLVGKGEGAKTAPTLRRSLREKRERSAVHLSIYVNE